MSENKNARWRLIITIATFVLLGLLIYGLRGAIADVLNNLGKVNATALLLMIPLQMLNYDAYVRLYRSLFDILGEKVRYWPMYKLNLELNFVNHILPSGGVSGISYFSVRMRGMGTSGTKATLSQIMKLLLLYVSFQPLLIFGVIALAARGHVNNFVMLVAGALITLLVVGTLIGIYIIESRSRISSSMLFLTRLTNSVIHFFRRNYKETISLENAEKAFGDLHENYMVLKRNWRKLKMPFIYTTIANLTEVATLYVVYVAFGEYVNIGSVILAYAIANFAGLISVLPAGIGIYEALMTGVLAATGVPASLSIPVTIMYRVLNMAIQLIPGYFFYHKAIREGLAPKPSDK
ncbi:MAG TPA: lysylphosphatidylglycerol synthase transmembrane domain-containing protein [Candidatus Saccharimonadales bacterium]|nr:lysylphosphatidylglycerol synthase transmembrane domain-containing protein [Candidatus Saccharimonadales bacterium]